MPLIDAGMVIALKAQYALGRTVDNDHAIDYKFIKNDGTEHYLVDLETVSEDELWVMSIENGTYETKTFSRTTLEGQAGDWTRDTVFSGFEMLKLSEKIQMHVPV